jgi:phosphoribosylanthranilate isomerase
MSKLIIKANEIGNLTDARYFSAREVDWLGFSLDSNNENNLPLQQIIAIREWISGPGIVAELGAMSEIETIRQVIEILKPDAIQVGPFCNMESVATAGSTPVIRELIPDTLEQLDDYLYEWRAWEKHLAFFLLNLEKNGCSWQQVKNNEPALTLLKQLCSEYELMLSLVFEPSELAEILEVLNPYGLSFNGDTEEKVGMKSFESLDDIFDNLEEINSLP